MDRGDTSYRRLKFIQYDCGIFIEKTDIDGLAIMKQSSLRGVAGDFKSRGILPYQVRTMAENMARPDVRMVDMGLLNKATGSIEYDIGQGCCVAAPTGGSCGVLPGAILSV